MRRHIGATANLVLLFGLARPSESQSCGFPWTFSTTPVSGQSVAITVCGLYTTCRPHNPQFTVSGSQVTITYTGAELPSCQCLVTINTFTDTIVVGPLVTGTYSVNLTLLECGQQQPSGSGSFTFAGMSSIPTLDWRGVAALVTVVAIAGVWLLRGGTLS